jgi:hypothetical protein
MWSSRKPVQNSYFWVGIVILMLVGVYGFWWLTESLDARSDAVLSASTTQIMRDAESLKR